MKTEIFKSVSDFLDRPDKQINGVSEEFAKSNPGFDKDNENESCWNCSRCYRCYRCSGCSDCSGCYDCYDCSRCSDCYDCSGKRDENKTKESKSWFDVPIVPKLHQKVLKAVEKPNALDMSSWHKCATTHCRAGWVVTLTGEKGAALERASSTLFAAMQICKASSKIRVSPVRFFETNEAALADIQRCAELEREAK